MSKSFTCSLPSKLGRLPLSILGSLGVMAIGWMIAIPQARAQLLVEDALAIAELTALNATQSATAAQLASLSAYLMGTVGVPPGNGLIALNTAMDARLAAVGAGVGEIPANINALDVLREQDKADLQVKKDRRPSYMKTNCYDVTMSAGRSATSGNAGRIKRNVEQKVLADRESYSADVDRRGLVNRALSHAEYCSQQDVSNKRPGCVGGSVSEIPNADIRSSTLTTSPISTGAQNQKPVYTLDPIGMKAAEAYIQNVLPLGLPQPDPAMRYSENNNIYLANAKRYDARVSVVGDVLSTLAGSHSENDGVVGFNEPSQIWGSAKNRATFKILFGDAAFPEKPSEMELMRFEIFKQISDPVQIAARDTMNEKEIALESIRVQALDTRATLMLIERTNDLIKIQATLLAQSLDPMTRTGVSQTLTTTSGTN